MRRGNIISRQDGIDFLSHTFLARRVQSNPTYYDVEPGGEEGLEEPEGWDGVKDRLSRIVDECMQGEKELFESRKKEAKKASKVLEVVKDNSVRHVPGSAPVVEGAK